MILPQLLLHLSIVIVYVSVCVLCECVATLDVVIPLTTTSSLCWLFLYLSSLVHGQRESHGASIDVIVRRSSFAGRWQYSLLPADVVVVVHFKYYHNIDAWHVMACECETGLRGNGRNRKKKKKKLDRKMFMQRSIRIFIFLFCFMRSVSVCRVFICNFRFTVRAQRALTHTHIGCGLPMSG